MWSIFTTNKNNANEILENIEDVKNLIFRIYEKKVKEHFAQKMVVYFDNYMILNKDKGLHVNLFEALSRSEKEMRAINSLFPDIQLYWFQEKNESSFMIKNLKEEDFVALEKVGFDFIYKTTNLTGDNKKLEFESMQTLLFSINLVNYAKDWIDHTPTAEERSRLQAVFMFLDMKVKKENLDLYQQIELERSLSENEAFQSLYDKIYKIMPKIEQSLEREWKYGLADEDKLGMDKAMKNIGDKAEEFKKAKTKM